MIFVYKTINLVNGKIYVGVHQGCLDDDYLGSGKAILAAIKKYGRENFKREIIKICDNPEEAFNLESEIVNATFVESDNTYNLTVGGKGGWYHAIRRGDENVMRRPDVAMKVSNTLKNSISEEERRARSVRMKNMRANGIVIKPAGWHHTENSKKKISGALTGKIGWNLGLKLPPESEETKKKKSNSAKIRAKLYDMGSLTRGKIRSPKLSCVKCQKTMYQNKFEIHQRGKCWKV